MQGQAFFLAGSDERLRYFVLVRVFGEYGLYKCLGLRPRAAVGDIFDLNAERRKYFLCFLAPFAPYKVEHDGAGFLGELQRGDNERYAYNYAEHRVYSELGILRHGEAHYGGEGNEAVEDAVRRHDFYYRRARDAVNAAVGEEHNELHGYCYKQQHEIVREI